MIRIAVCMKQVPAYSEGNMDEKTGLIMRLGLQAVVNMYDMSALECALRIKEEIGGEVIVFSMGPKKAEEVIREALACGADDGYLISDKYFAGADVLATSYTLMQAIQSTGEYDLILCGKQTTDGDTSQVTGALARWMEIPHLTGVCEILQISKTSLKVKMTAEDFFMTQRIKFPCLIAVERDGFIPRMPSLRFRMAARKKEIPVITKADLEDQDEQHYGLAGSATKVKKIFPPMRTKHQSVKVYTGEEAAENIQNILEKIGVIG